MTDPETAGGAVRELARDDVERKRFLRMAGRTMGAAGAASALGAFIAACGSNSSSSSTTAASSGATSSGSGTASGSGPASGSGTASAAATPTGDLAIVNYALTLEYLEAEFYDKVVASGMFSGSVLAALKQFRSEEHAHVAALETVAKSMGTPAAKPRGKFPIDSATQVAKLAATVENLGAAAYLGQAGNIKSKEILAAALSIHTVEARHAAVLSTVTGQSPTPDGAFGGPMSMAQVLAVVKPFIA